MDKFNCILYGESGVGKTPFCGTLQGCEKTSPCLLLDVDMGAMSLSKPGPTVLPIDRWALMAIIYDKMLKCDWQGLAELIHKETEVTVPVLEYKAVVIDSGTELEYNLRRDVVGANEKGDGEVASQPDYLRTQERFKTMYRKFRDLPLTLVMTAGIRELKEESTGIVKRSPDFQPAVAHDMVRMTDFVIYMSVTMEGVGKEAQWKRHLLTSLSQRFIARSRSDKLPAFMEGEKFYFKDICAKILD